MVANRYFPYRNLNTELKVSKEPVLNFYQPDSTVSLPDIYGIQHFVLVLNGQDQWEVDNWNLLTEPDQDIPILLTIELWDRQVLQKMKSGAYDEKLKNLFTKKLADRKKLYLRWNPQMEVNNSGLPWGNQGSTFAEAFKEFARLCRKHLPNSKIVWGPAGDTGLMECYPGQDGMDFASITLKSTPEEEESSSELLKKQLKRKLHRMRFIEVPVLILGSSNKDFQNFKNSWINLASEEIQLEKNAINFQNIFSVKAKDPQLKNNQNLLMGVFDPNDLLINEPEVSVEHVFINFDHIQNETVFKDLKEIFNRNHDAIITVEPSYLNDSKKDDRTILKSIINGEFDNLLSQFYKNLPKTDQIIYLRFAHEMEIPIKRYSWQSQDPIEYIKAFRYFMLFPEKEFPNIKRVWGPAGDRGLLEWWPGEDVVDVISIAIYGLPDKNITDPHKQESFEKIYMRKKSRIAYLNKPLFITELGVKGDEEFQALWLVNAAKIIKSEKNIMGISYFNRQDVPKAWGDIKPPQWEISTKTFKSFTRELDISQLQTISD